MSDVYRGIVQKGTKRAATLGFPTINIPLKDRDVTGIYAAQVMCDGKTYLAAAYADQKRGILEAHIIDMRLNLYGKEVSITLEKKIRDNQKFGDDELLRAAVSSDLAAIREHFRII